MPTVVISENSGADFAGVVDSRLPEIDPTTNYGSDGTVAATNFGGGDLQSFVITFDLSGIPGGSIVSSATLDLYGDTFVGSPSWDLHRLLLSYTEAGVTWNSRNGTNNWNTGGARGSGTDHSATVTATVTGTTTGDFNSISTAQLATDVQNAAGGSISWVGLPTTGTNTASIYVSSEGTDGNRPRLSVTYTEPGSSTPVVVWIGI